MADEFVGVRDGYGGMRASTNPVAHVQLITYNATTAEWKSRRRNPKPKYGGPVDHDHMTVLGSEPTVRERATRILKHNGSIDKESTIRVFSTLNGWGKEEWSKYDCLQRLRWGGFKGYRTKEDPKDMDTQIDFPVYHGGLFTTNNNGYKPIMHGDLVYWDIPGDEAEAQKVMEAYVVEGQLSGRRGDRRAVFLMAYNSHDQTVNRHMIREVVDRPYKGTSVNGSVSYAATLKGQDGYIRKANANVVEALKSFGTLCILAERAGVIGSSKSAEEIHDELVNYIRRNDHSMLFGQMGLLSNERDIVLSAGHALTQALMRIASPQNLEDRIYEKTDIGTTPEAINKIQRGHNVGSTKHGNVLDRLLMSVVAGNDYVKRRIIGKAQNSAAPGQSFDIIAIP